MEQPPEPVPPADENQPLPVSTSEVPEPVEDKPLEGDESAKEVTPTQPSEEEEGAAGPSSVYPMDEVFRVNRLLQIENMDWSCQLEQAVRNFQFLCQG